MSEQQALGPRTLLACFAHPDDETLGPAGVLAHYAASGTRVALVSATLGECGEIADAALATPETLPQVREQELRCACRSLGISELILLGYRDSGMQGSPENQHPNAYINANSEEVVRQLVGVIRRLRPLVVLTFEPNGGYGHPDHKAIHRHTLSAFHAAGDPQRYPEQGAPWQPARLFYTSLTRSFFRELRRRMAERGMDTSAFDGQTERGWPDELANTVLDVSAVIEAKWAAMLCHRTQAGTFRKFMALPEPETKQLFSQESFALAWPEPAPGTRLSDLCEGLQL